MLKQRGDHGMEIFVSGLLRTVAPAGGGAASSQLCGAVGLVGC